MDSNEPSLPPKIPPKKSKKPSIDNASSTPPSTRDASPAGSATSSHASHMADVQSSSTIDSTNASVMARSLDNTINTMMDSIAELDRSVNMSTSLLDTNSPEQMDSVMTTSLPMLPSETSKAKPTPRPRATVKNKPQAAKRVVNQSTSSPATGMSPSSSPKPCPRSTTGLHKSRSAAALMSHTAAVQVPHTSAVTVPHTSAVTVPHTSAITVPHTSAVTVPHTSIVPIPHSSTPPITKASSSSLDVSDQFSYLNGDDESALYSNVETVSRLDESSSTKGSTVVVTAEDNTYCNTVPAEPIYNNAEDEDLQALRTADMPGIPLPPSQNPADSSTITPLSQAYLSILDPVQYMALWELKGTAPPTSSSGASVTDSPSAQACSSSQPLTKDKKKAGPPIPPRASDNMLDDSGPPLTFTYPQPTTDSAAADDPTKQALIPNIAGQNRITPSAGTAEFRNSFTLSFPEDPFASIGRGCMFGTNCSDTTNASANSSQSENVYSLADDPDIQRLLPRRAAPPVPSQGVSTSQSTSAASAVPDNPPLYSQINKTIIVPLHDNTSPYVLAEDVDTWFDNPAVSYDSEETVDEDSDEYDTVPSTPLPVAPSPRSAQTDRHGYLYKQGGKQNNKGWRKRYVTFDGDRLRYFSAEKSRISKRIIPVMVMRSIESDVKETDSEKFRFRVLTMNRNYLFAAETLADHSFWTQILMKSIIKYKQENGIIRGSIGQGLMPGGTMHTPDINGYVRLDDNKQYVAVKDGKLCYYKNENDYQFATPIHEVCLNIASVKDVGKHRLQFTTPYHTYSMNFEGDADLMNWKMALEDGIASALSDDRVLQEVYRNPSNEQCADCSATKPHWAVLHLSTIVCSSCAGIHRQFWPFKVKSLRMDVKVWTKALINLHVTVGNSTINSVWEARLSKDSGKPKSIATLAQRQSFIVKKYLHKSFFLASLETLPQKLSTQQLCQELAKSIKEGLITNVIYLVNKGADLVRGAASVSPVQLAESSFQLVIAQYLKVNGAENESFDDIWNVIKQQYSTESTEDTVMKSGYLYRMGKKDYPRQWLVLTSQSLKIFDEETDEEPKSVVSCRKIVNLARHENDKNEPSIEFTCSPSGTTYVYGADDKSTIDLWLSILHKVMLMNSGQTDLGYDFTKAGHAHCKRGLLGEWKLCWMLLKKRQLHMLDSNGAANEEVDLRKIHNISSAVPEDKGSPGPGEEKGPIITLFISDRSNSLFDQSDIIYYIQSDLKHETEKWFRTINDVSKEVSPNLDEQQLNKDNVPTLIEKCVDFISLNGMKVEGIYRHAGTHSKVTNLLNDLIKDAKAVVIKGEDYTVNDVANALKRFLRNLQEPIMSSALYGKWLSAAMFFVNSDADPDRANHNQKLYTYKALLEELPKINFATLKMLIGHLKSVVSYEAENKMSSLNLATVFGPVLLSGSIVDSPTQEKFKNTTYEIKLVDDLITYYQWLFSMDDSEIDKQHQLQVAILKIQEAKQRPARPTGEFLVGIYILNNMGDAMNIEMPASRTAEEVVLKVAESKRIPCSDGYSLFHVICSGELERSLAPSEKVLDVNMISGEWNAEHRKGCYLCVKQDQLRDFTDHLDGSDICRYTELQFSEKKGWKKLYFELNESHLISYKDKSKNKLHEWELSQISVYVGVEKKRKPPTKHGVTFLIDEEDCSKQTYLGRSLCFGSAVEMYTWLSAINAQSHEPLLSPLGTSPSSYALSDGKKSGPSKNRMPSILKKITGAKS